MNSLAQVDSIGEYLKLCGSDLAAEADRRNPPLHVRGAVTPYLGSLLRRPFQAQADAIAGAAKALKRQKSAWLIAEPGTGKTLMAAAIAWLHAEGKPFRCLVHCPPQLTKKWVREIEETIPGAKARIIEDWEAALAIPAVPPTGPEFFVLSCITAKLQSGWRGAWMDRLVIDGKGHYRIRACPRCGAQITNAKGDVLSKDALLVSKRSCQKCGEALWQCGSSPRRLPASLCLKRGLPFDYLIADEGHQQKGADTQTGAALGALASICRKTLLLTGTVIGGKADDLRSLLFRTAPTRISSEFTWKDSGGFAERYGRIDSATKDRNGKKVTTKSIRPGIQPQLFGDMLLPLAVFMRLDDLAADLPPYEEKIITVKMNPEQASEYAELADRLASAGAEMARRGDKRLLGTTLEALLHYVDYPFDWKPLGYREGEAFITVALPRRLSEEVTYPKEAALLRFIHEELDNKRQVWVYSGRDAAQERIMKDLEGAGIPSTRLTTKVKPQEREAWIREHGPKNKVIVSNPALVETGLELFGPQFNFATMAWYSADFMLTRVRQASRRSYRIGQTKPTKVAFFAYERTAQERALILMSAKLRAAQAIDGEFSLEGLAALDADDDLQMALVRELINQARGD